MKIRILSDLHREFGPTLIPRGQADLIILAGDIATKLNGLPWILDFCGDTPTAVVCGNHEFYGDKLPRVRARLAEATRGTNIHILEDDHFSITGWHVYGCTLWTDFALYGDWKNGTAVAGECMNDYKRIRNSDRFYRRLSPQDTRALHQQSVMKMNSFFERNDSARTIVVTHHAPSALSLPPSRHDKTLSCAYASHLDDFILRHQPPLWIHGHIHHSNDYFIGSTRIISNPQGYPDEANPDFNPSLCLEL